MNSNSGEMTIASGSSGAVNAVQWYIKLLKLFDKSSKVELKTVHRFGQETLSPSASANGSSGQLA